MDKPTVVKSTFYNKAEKKAEEIANNKSTMMKLFDNVLKLADKLTNFGRLGRLKNSLLLMVRMLKAYYDGRYKAIPWKTLVKLVSALLYFVFIIDFVPDFIPFIGYLDDAAVMLWIWNSVQIDIEKYKAWEQQHAEKDKNNGSETVATN